MADNSDAIGTAISMWVHHRRKRAARVLIALFVLLGALIMVLEIDRLIAGSLSRDGASSPLGGVISPLALTERDAWEAWASSTAAGGSIPFYIVASVLLDIAIVFTYFWAFSKVITRMTQVRQSAARTTLWVAVWAEIAEGVLLSGGAVLLGLGGSFSAFAQAELFGIVVALASTLKWLALAVLVVLLLRDHTEGVPNSGSRGYLAELVRRLSQAFWVHRLSSFLVLLLFLLACIPSDEVLDQLPDVQRQWVGLEWAGLGHAFAAGVAVLLAAFCALALGRARTRALVSARQGFAVSGVTTTGRDLIWWFAPIAVWVALYLLTWATTGDWLPSWIAIVFVGIPAVVLLSYWRNFQRPWPVEPRPDLGLRARYAWLVGDATAVMIIGIGGLGLIRSFTAPIFSGSAISGGLPYLWSCLLLGTGVVLTVFSPMLIRLEFDAAALFDPAKRIDRPQDRPLAAQHRRAVFLFFMGGLIVLAFLAFLPIQIAALIGASAVTVLALTSWGAVLGAFTVAVQDRKPAPVFRFMRLRATPVLTLAITLPLIASVIFAFADWDDPDLHAARAAAGNGSAKSSDPADFRTVVNARLNALAKDPCVATAGGKSFIPAIVVVAEGGGIRAAYWTTRALQKLQSTSECLADSILLSSGVSGGSVGLAATAVSERRANAETDLAKLAGPTTVGTGVAGLLVGDLMATNTGVHFPSYWKGETEWRDRAALIEHAWIDSVPGLDKPVTLEASDRIGIPVLNSTDARSKCKLLVADQVAGGADLTCAANAMSPAVTLPMQVDCFAGMDWATSAMLSARFPIITPAARFDERDGCGTEDLQLIDGGYAEGSGLGTAADLAPTIADAVSEWNAAANRDYPIVPVLVFLKNSAGYDLRHDLDAVAAEPLVPVVGFAASSKQTAQEAWIQRIAAAFGTVGAASDDAGKALKGLRGELPALTVVVAPSTEPAVVPPLGWALSSYSIGSLERALETKSGAPQREGIPNLHTLTSLASRAADDDKTDVAEADSDH